MIVNMSGPALMSRTLAPCGANDNHTACGGRPARAIVATGEQQAARPA
jgi:hypothetical protein